MSIIQGLNFDNALNFNSSGIDFTGGLARLSKVSNTGQTFNQSFASATGFTYDNTKAEFTGGLLRQKDLRPASAIFGSTYTSSKNANWDYAGSSLTATDTGSPVINAGFLDCLGYGNVGVSYTNTSFAVVTNNGSIKFKYKPNYSGAPTSTVGLMELIETGGGNANRIIVYHSVTTGYIAMVIYNSAGTLIGTTNSSAFIPVAGTTYEIEIGWATDSPNRYTYIFLNGVAVGGNTIGSMARTNTATKLRVGSNTFIASANGSFDDVVIFNTTQHIVGYTPGYTLPEASYVESIATLPVFTYSGVGTIQALSNLATTQVSVPKFIIKGQFWNGSSWVASSDTYATASTLAEVIANAATLSVAGDSTVTMKVVFGNSNSLSSIDDLTLTYTGQKYTSDGWMEPLVGISTSNLIAITMSYSETTNSKVRLIMKDNGIMKYWSGTAWVASNGTFAQANTLADFNTNIASYSFTQNDSVVMRFLINTTVITETATATWADIEYDFGAIAVPTPTCIIYGYYKDISGNPVSGASVKFSLVKNSGAYSEADSTIIEKSSTVLTDTNGYFSCNLIWSSQYENGGTYQMSITKTADKLSITKNSLGEPLTFLVPDLTTKDITGLITA